MTATRPRTDRPLTAWRMDPHLNPRRLTHAARPGQNVAYCGVQISTTGEPWPDPAAPTLLSRCATCTHAVFQLWS